MFLILSKLKKFKSSKLLFAEWLFNINVIFNISSGQIYDSVSIAISSNSYAFTNDYIEASVLSPLAATASTFPTAPGLSSASANFTNTEGTLKKTNLEKF